MLLSLLLALPALAQTTTGSIEGTVQDQTGARIPAAEVAAIHEATGQKWTTEASPEGAFRLLGLPAGIYRVEITRAGFARRVVRGVQVSADSTTALPETLSADAVTEQVTVVGAPPLVQATRATQSATIGSTQLESVPSSSRHYTHLLVTEPGVSAGLVDRTGGESANSNQSSATLR